MVLVQQHCPRCLVMQFLDPMNLLNHKVLNILVRKIKITSTTYLAAGAMSELAASNIYTPFEVVKTRMQLGNSWLNAVSPRVYTGTFNAFKTILNNEGLGLYSGYRACILTDCTYSALQFLVYEKSNNKLKNDITPNMMVLN